MLDWYRETIGLTVNKRVAVPPGRAPFTTVAFASNDEINHRMSFFEMPDASIDGDRSRHARVQHIAFAYENLDDLLGTYVRLKNLGMMPMWAADQSFQRRFTTKIRTRTFSSSNCDNLTNVWAVTEQLKFAAFPAARVYRSRKAGLLARRAGASPWEIHQRAFAGEFVPDQNHTIFGPELLNSRSQAPHGAPVCRHA